MSNTLKFGAGNWATKEGSTLAYNDENGNFKPLPFDFSRASNATVVNKDGLIETVGSGIPRIDFLGNTKGALKLEPSRSNYQPYSTDFSSWSVVDVTVGLNYGLSPDGFNNSVLITEGTGSTQHRIVKGSPTSSGIYTLSCFVKNKVGNRQAYIDMGAVTGFFNFDTETMFSAAGTTSVESWSNGWYRISITSNTNVTPTVNYLGTGKNNSETFQGDGSSAIEFFAPQLELGSYPTSYIPTQGSAVTRLRDLSDTQNLSHVIGQTEGVIFYDAILVHKSTSTAEDLYELSIDDGSNQNIFFINNYNNTLVVALNNGGSNQFANNSFNPTEGGRYKLAFAYKQNDFALYINGNQIATDSSGTVPTMNQITFGNYYNNQLNLSNSVKVNNLKFYNTRLSNSELQALTQV